MTSPCLIFTIIQIKNLQRGYATPDPPKQRVIPEHNFTMGIEKVQSLDFNQPVSGETQIEQPKASLAVSSTAVKENTSNSAVPGATTGQSLFNMINSLLVRSFIIRFARQR